MNRKSGVLIVNVFLTEEEKKLLDKAIEISPLAIGTRRKFHSFVENILLKTLRSIASLNDTGNNCFTCCNDRNKDTYCKFYKFLSFLDGNSKTDSIARKERVLISLNVPHEEERKFLKKNFVIRKLVKACLLYAAEKVIELERSSSNKRIKRNEKSKQNLQTYS